MATVGELLEVLPPFSNRSVLIESAQEVPDIMEEVAAAHKCFANDYDLIWQFFYNSSLEDTCIELFEFCKEHIRYEVEGEEGQTTKSPAAILAMGHGDCKHYAGFISGVLSAIARGTGSPIDWCYRFASYDMFNDEPGHVFVVVRDGKDSFWIDPVLNGFDERLEPTYFIDKKISLMPLYRVSGIGQPQEDYLSSALDMLGYDAGRPDMGETVGVVVDPSLATAIISTAFTEVEKLFADQVASYPVEKQSTFDSLVSSVMEHVGTVAPMGVFRIRPATVEQAELFLQKAIKRKNEEIALGHGYGDGPGWDTLQMLYDETILSLQNIIAITLKGATIIPQTTTQPGGSLSLPTSISGIDPAVIAAVAGVATYFLTKKLMISAVVGVGAYLLTKKSQPVTQYPTTQYPTTQYPTTQQPSSGSGILEPISDILSSINWDSIFSGGGSSETETPVYNENDLYA